MKTVDCISCKQEIPLTGPFVEFECPVCGAKVIEKKTKRGRKFYVCENGPEKCIYISWNKPKVGEKWTPEIEKENSKKKATKKKTRKRKTTKKK